MDRHDRALLQRMYLLDASRPGDMAWEFMIEGSRGVPYRVYMNPAKSSCTCPDYVRRRQPCKHIIFISLRVLRLGSSFTTLTRLMDDALKKTLLDKAEAPAEEPAEEPSKAEAEEPKDDKPLEGCCPICYEDFEPSDKCERCATCKNAIHGACITIWLRQKPNCPLCRSTWARPSAQLVAGKRPVDDDVLRKFGREHFTGALEPTSSSSAETDRMTATDAKRKFGLSEADLSPLSHLTLSNPAFSGGAPMRLYRILDIERVAQESANRKAKEEREVKAAAKRAEKDAKDAKIRETAEKKRAKEAEKEAKRQGRELKASKKVSEAAAKAAKEPKSKKAKTNHVHEMATASAPSTSRRSGRVIKSSRLAAASQDDVMHSSTTSKRARRV